MRRFGAVVAATAVLGSSLALASTPATVGAIGDGDATLRLIVDPASIAPGGSSTLTASVTNSGMTDITAPVSVDIVLPAEIVADATGWPCTPSVGTALTCTLTDPIAAASATSLSFPITLDIGAADELRTISGTVAVAGDPDPSNDSWTVRVGTITDLASSADVSVVPEIVTWPVTEGATETIRYTVTNNGPDDADDLLLFTDLVGFSWSGGTDCTIGCSLGTLPQGGETQIDFTAVVTGAEGTFVSATASTFSDELDPFDSNQSGTSASVEAAIPPGGITGTISVGAVPEPGASVSAYRLPDYDASGWDETDANGFFSIDGLPDGDYEVTASIPDAAGRYYPGTTEMASSIAINVSGGVVSDVDIPFPGGTIAGSVSYRGAPAPFAQVGASNDMNYSGGTTDENGVYVIRGLDDGTYHVNAVVNQGSAFYGDPGGPTDIVIGPATPNVTDIDIVVPPGVLTGTLLDADGLPVPWGTATAQQTDGDGYVTTSINDSAFTLAGLAEGTWIVTATGDMGSGSVSSDPIVIAPGSYDVVVPTLQLPIPGTVSGVIWLASSDPGGRTMTLEAIDGSNWYQTTTNPDGTYSFGGVAVGEYYLYAEVDDGSGVYRVYYEFGSSQAAGADTVTVTSNGLTIANISEPLPGSIEGTVTDAASVLLEDVTVNLQTPWGSTIATTTTDSFGHYSFAGLPPGTPYVVQFVPPPGSGLRSEYYLDKPDAWSADQIVLGSEELATANAELEAIASVSGSVTNTSGDPVDAVVLMVAEDDSLFYASTVGGIWTAENVPPATYVVYVQPGGINQPSNEYAPEFYGGSYDEGGATPIVVTDGAMIPDVDVVVDAGFTMSGRVTTTSGQSVSQAEILLDDPNDPLGYDILRTRVRTGGDGRWTVGGLAPGDYRVSVIPSTGSGLLTEYWPGVYERTAAGTVSVAGSSVSGLDLVLETGVFGDVTIFGASGQIPSTSFGAGVVVCRAPGQVSNFSCDNGESAPVSTAPGGAWRVGPIAPGDHIAYAVGFSFVGDPVPFTVDTGDGFSCTLTDGNAPENDECLVGGPSPSGSISGRVTGPSGTGVSGVYVSIPAPNNVPLVGTFTDAAGYWSLDVVPSGGWTLQFSANDRPDLLPEWWSTDGDAFSADDADTIVIGADDELDGFDVRLDRAASGAVDLTLGGIVQPFSTGQGAILCPSSAPYTGGFFQCSDGTPWIATTWDADLGRNVASTIPPGEWAVTAFAFDSSTFTITVGATGLVDLASGSTFDCSLPLEASETATCSVSAPPVEDSDGIDDDTESGAPNDGDGNGDTIPDAEQNDVASVLDPATDEYVTVEVAPTGGSTATPALSEVVVATPPADAPPIPGDAQSGFVSFEVTDLPIPAPEDTVGETVAVTVFLSAPANAYYKLIDGVWEDFTSIVTFDPVAVEIEPGVFRWKAILTLTDGAFGDLDGLANGVIVDPGVFVLDATGPSLVLDGFGAPIDMDALNRAKRGQAVPVKFRTTLDDGTVVDSLEDATAVSRPVACPGGSTPTTVIDEPVDTAGPSVQYLGDGWWQFNWKTSKSWTTGCRQLEVTVGGESLTALFEFR